MTRDPVVILSALNVEYDALRHHLTDIETDHHPRGTRFEIGTVRGTSDRVVLGLVGTGNNSAAVLAERAIQHFSPGVLLFSGVAGAVWDLPLGDVVVATRVYAYHGATSEDDGTKARPRSWEIPHELHQIATHIARSGSWTSRLPLSAPKPTVHFGPIAAGEVVHNSRVSYDAIWVREHFNDAYAFEMEGAGVAQAGHLSGVSVGVVRGLSDRADGSKGSTNDRRWQPRAAGAAAAFAVQLASELSERSRSVATPSEIPHQGKLKVTNVAHGPAGIQGVHIDRSVVIQNTPQLPQSASDLVAELRSLRAQLDNARATGAIDTDTLQAAHAEIDQAESALSAGGPDAKSRVVMSLKRLRGLVIDVVDVAANVAVLLTAAGALP